MLKKKNIKKTHIGTKTLLQNNELVFLVAILLKMTAQTVSISVLPEMIGPEFCSLVFKLMTYSSYLLVMVSFLLTSGYKIKELLILGGITVFAVLGSFFSGTGILLTIIYIYGAKNIDLDKIIGIVCLCYSAIFGCIVIGSRVGIIENWDFFQNSNRPRWGLGYSYPTHTSSVLFMVVLLICFTLKERIKFIHIILIEIVNYWVFSYTNSRAGAILVAVVPVLFYFLGYTQKATYDTRIGWLLQWSFPVCAITIYFLTIRYDDYGIYKVINNLLSNRLKFSQTSMSTYGIHLFGQKIQWVGWGGIGHTQTQLAGAYNYVDSSYLKLLLENGIIVWAIIMIGWTLVSIYAYRENKKYLLWALAILAFYCVAEQWLMNIGANPFVLFLSVPVFYMWRPAKNKTGIYLEKSNRI